MSLRTSHALYALNVALLATHQADAAYQREWELFGVPGGIELFLAFNAGAVLALVLGLAWSASGHRLGRAMTLACVATGFITCAIHGVFLVLDRAAFWSPASLGVLGAILLVSGGQLAAHALERSTFTRYGAAGAPRC